MSSPKKRPAVPDPEPGVDFLTPPEVARILGLSRNTIYDALKLGQIPGQLRIGRRYRISRRVFERAVYGEARDAAAELAS